ncbi:MAG TPA: ABC transporter ATP-binding protein [Acidimicrobiales bacterium]|nr:ABC transporter ATP-binding protein [Acidimicrobiales bacterium]
MDATPRLVVEGAAVRFGPVTALDGVSLSVAVGETIAVLGPSGCGKTTLLRAVAGLQRLDAGRVVIDGEDMAAVPPHRRRLGLMFQDHALFPHRDVAANVGFGLRMQQRPRQAVADRVDEMLALVGLSHARARAVHELSGGEQQRVALARAIAPEPQLLLLDEPLGALDRGLREELTDELRSIFATVGTTAVYVTHDQGEAAAVADRIALMDAGRVVQIDTAVALWRRPATRWAATFLGYRNVLDVDVAGGRATTAWGPITVPGAADGRTLVVLRPDAFTVTHEGPLRGRVTRVVPGGAHLRLTVTAGDADLDVAAAWDPAPAVGDDVRLAVAPWGVVVVT